MDRELNDEGRELIEGEDEGGGENEFGPDENVGVGDEDVLRSAIINSWY